MNTNKVRDKPKRPQTEELTKQCDKLLGGIEGPLERGTNGYRFARLIESQAARFINDYDNLDKWCVYILECNDGSLYTGITNNIIKRLDAHNAGNGAKYTRGRLPVILEEYKFVDSKSEALKLEYKVKQQPKHQKIEFLRSS